MQTHLIQDSDTGKAHSYTSDRVFNGMRPLKGNAKKRYLTTLRKAVTKKKKKQAKA